MSNEKRINKINEERIVILKAIKDRLVKSEEIANHIDDMAKVIEMDEANIKEYNQIANKYAYGWLFSFSSELGSVSSTLNYGNIWNNQPYMAEFQYGNYTTFASYIASAINAYKSGILVDLPTILNRDIITKSQYEKLRTYIGSTIRYNGIYYQFQILF